MTENRGRFVLLSRQVLVVAVTAAVAIPAAGVTGSGSAPPADGAASQRDPLGDRAGEQRLVAAAPVEPTVRRVPLQVAGAGNGLAEPVAHRPVAHRHDAHQEIERDVQRDDEADVLATSGAERVQGYGTVGVTWDSDATLAEDEVRVQVRTAVNGSWSAWQEMEYRPEHGPDPSTREGRAADLRAGTEPVVVGDVDQVQVRATTSGAAVDGLALEVIDPGNGPTTVAEPAIGPAVDTSMPTSEGDVQLAGLSYRPKIYKRSQWGADERLRDKKSLSYGRVRTGFVHHTVNANGYSSAQVPQIIRGIYAYHTRSRGWSDIGYNFLVDRFGRIWEGRAGGVTRSVVGAHTYGYNRQSFAMSAIGNFDTTRPSAKMVMAYGTLWAWKLGVHKVNAAKSRVWVKTGEFLAPVSGHRDAGATACPGRYLYAQLPTITRRARWLQDKFNTF